jgi:hypothetical protein
MVTYCIVGCTHSARLDGSVQGVVVHATKETEGSSSRGKETTTARGGKKGRREGSWGCSTA